MILQKRLQINGSGSRTVFRNPITGESRVTTIHPATAPNASVNPVQTRTQQAMTHPSSDEVTGLQGADVDSANRVSTQGRPQLNRVLTIFRNAGTTTLRVWLEQFRNSLAANNASNQAGPILNDYDRIFQALAVLIESDASGRNQWWVQYQQTMTEVFGNRAASPPVAGRLDALNLSPELRLYYLHLQTGTLRRIAKTLESAPSTRANLDALFINLYSQMIGICEGELHFNTDPAARENPLYLIYLGLRLETPLSEDHAVLIQRQRAREFLEWFNAHDENWFEQHLPTGSDFVMYAPNGPIGNWTHRVAYFLRHPERLTVEQGRQTNPPRLTGEAIAAQDLLSALHRLSVPTPAESAAVALNNTTLLALLGILIPVYTYSGQMQNANELTNFTQAVRAQIDLFPSKSLREILESLKTPAAGVPANPDAQRVARFILETRNLTFRNLVGNLLRENQDTELAPLYGIHERDFLSPTGMRDAINNINAMPLLAERYGITQLDINNPHHQRCMEDLLIREIALRHYLGQSLDAIIPADAQPGWVEWWRNRANTITAEEVANQFVEHVSRAYDQTRDAFSHLPYLSDETNLAHLTLSYWASFMLRADQLGFDLSANSRSRLLHLNQRLQDWDNHSLTAALGETFTGNNILTMLGTALIYEFLEVLVVARGPGRLVAESGRMNLWGSVVTGGSAGTISAIGSTLAHHRWGGDHPLRVRDFGHDMGVNIAGQSTGLILYAAGQSFRNPFTAFAFSQAGRFGSAFAISEGDSYFTNDAWLSEHQRDVFYMSYGANALVHGAVRYSRYRWAASNAAGDPENPGWLARGTFGEPNIRRIQTTPSLRANDPDLLSALQRSFWNPQALDDFLNDQNPSSPSTPPSLPNGRNPQVSVPNVPIEGVTVAVGGNRYINARNAANPDAASVMPSDFDIEVWVDTNGKLWARDLSNTGRPIRGVDHRNGQSEFVVIPNNGTPTKIQGGRIEVYAAGANPATDRPIFQISITGNTPTPVPPAPQPAPFSGPAAPASPFQAGDIAPTRQAAPEPTRVGPRPRPVYATQPSAMFPATSGHTIVGFFDIRGTFRIMRGNGFSPPLDDQLPGGLDLDVIVTPGSTTPTIANHSTRNFPIRVQNARGEWVAIRNNGGEAPGDTVRVYPEGANPDTAPPVLEFQLTAPSNRRTLVGGGMGGLPGAPTGAPPTRPGGAAPAVGGRGIPDTIIRTAPEEQPAPARGPRDRRDDDYVLPPRPPVPEWARSPAGAREAPTRLAAPDPRAVAQPARFQDRAVGGNTPSGGLALALDRPTSGNTVLVNNGVLPRRFQGQMPEGVDLYFTGGEDGNISVAARNASTTPYRLRAIRNVNGSDETVEVPTNGSSVDLGEGNTVLLYRPNETVATVTLYAAVPASARPWWQWRPWQ